jgi:hypothetical protein
MGLLGKDGTGADSGQPIVSAYTPSIVKRHKAIKTSEFGSGSTSDKHGGCPREQSQLTAFGDIHSSFETCTRPNASVCNPENTVARYGSTEAVTTYTDIYEEQDANAEAYLERSIPAQAVECLKSMKLGHQERDLVGFGHQRLNHYYQTLPMHKHSEKHP